MQKYYTKFQQNAQNTKILYKISILLYQNIIPYTKFQQNTLLLYNLNETVSPQSSNITVYILTSIYVYIYI